MDHSFIEEHNQIDRYVRGTMPVAERAALEQHFLDCPACLEQLEVASSLRTAIRTAAADMAPSVEPAVRASRNSWLRGLFAWRWMQVAMTAGFAAAVLAGMVLYRQLEGNRSELRRTQLAYDRERERARTTIQGAERNAPVLYALNQSRDTGSQVRTLEIPLSPRWVIFSIEFDASQYPTYRATVRSESGQAVWQSDNLQPSSPDSIAIPVLSTRLTPGSYALTLEGRDASGRYIQVSNFSIQSKAQP